MEFKAIDFWSDYFKIISFIVQNIYFIYTTVSDLESAQNFVHSALSTKLIACANIIGPGESYWLSNGEVCKNSEHYIVMKGISDDVNNLTKDLRKIHPYDIPVICCINVDNLNSEYINWLNLL